MQTTIQYVRLSYFWNISTCLAVAGDDFCIVAADSRLSVGYSILSRTTPKTSQLTQHCVIASSGCNSDQVFETRIVAHKPFVMIMVSGCVAQAAEVQNENVS